MDDERLTPSELARQRRRDRDATAAERAGMRTGLAKGMKQIMDAQARRAAEARDKLARSGTTPPADRESDAVAAKDDAAGPGRTARSGRAPRPDASGRPGPREGA